MFAIGAFDVVRLHVFTAFGDDHGSFAAHDVQIAVVVILPMLVGGGSLLIAGPSAKQP